MTVKVMTNTGGAAVMTAKEAENVKPEMPAEQEPETVKAPLVYLPAEQGYDIPRVRLRRTSRRKTVSFGGIILVQTAVSCVLAGALWAGMSFGSGELISVLTGIAELFR